MAGFKLTAPVEPERTAQVDDAKMLRILLKPDVAWTAVDHGHSMNMTIGRSGQPIGLIEARKRKARGVRAGIPDYLFWRDGRGYAIERKVRRGRESGEQKQFHLEMRAAGVPVATCWDQREICDTLTEWGLLRPYKTTTP